MTVQSGKLPDDAEMLLAQLEAASAPQPPETGSGSLVPPPSEPGGPTLLDLTDAPLDGSVIWLADEHGAVVEAHWFKTRRWDGRKWADGSRWMLWPGTQPVPFEPLGWYGHE